MSLTQPSPPARAPAITGLRRRLTGWQPATILLLLGFLIWGGILRNDFTFDDLDVIVYRIQILFFRPWYFFTRDYFHFAREMSWRPATTATYVVDLMIYSRSPVGFHLTNLLIHLATVLCFWGLVRRVSGSASAALVAAIVAMVHPAAGSAVCIVGFREELIVAFGILAAWACWGFPREARWSGLWGVGAVLASAIAILGKELGAVMPVATVLVWLAARQCGRPVASVRRVLGVVGVQTGLVLLYVALFFGPMHSLFSQAPGGYGTPGPARALATFCWIHLRYLGLLLWPAGYAADHPVTAFGTILDPRALAGAAVLVVLAVVGAVGMARRGWSAVAGLGLLWWGLFLAPVSGIAPLPNPMADRFLYAPLFGFALVTGWIWWRIRRTILRAQGQGTSTRARRNLLLITAGILLVVWMRASVDEVANHRSQRSLWEWTLKAEPQSTRALHNLGVDALNRMDMRTAAACFESELRLKPDDWKTMILLSNALRRLHRTQEADGWLDRALALAPGQREVHEARVRRYLLARPPDPQKARQALEEAQQRYHVPLPDDLISKVNALAANDQPTSP